MSARKLWLSVWFLCAACGVDSGKPVVITAGDPALYADYVQPLLAARCASLDCHGDGGRIVRLYSELGLRMDNALRTKAISEHSEPTVLTAEELAENQLALAAVALGADASNEHLALLKPLPVSKGGIHHVGGTHFKNKEDAGYLCLRGYLVGDVKGDVQQLCSDALAATEP